MDAEKEAGPGRLDGQKKGTRVTKQSMPAQSGKWPQRRLLTGLAVVLEHTYWSLGPNVRQSRSAVHEFASGTKRTCRKSTTLSVVERANRHGGVAKTLGVLKHEPVAPIRTQNLRVF
jgi:hypothetical protein